MEIKNAAPMLMHNQYLAKKRDRETHTALLASFGNRLQCFSGSDKRNAVYGNGYLSIGGVAVVPVMGAMMKGHGYPDQSELRSVMGAIKEDRSVSAVLKIFDSPGGSVAGTADYADSISATGKPTYAYCEDMCCSAAYWAASSCSKIFANSTAFVGSIGVISWLTDATKMYEDMGIKEIPIMTGTFKAAGDPSQEATPEIIDYMQGKIDAIFDQFVGAVNKGRGISKTAIKEMNAAVYVGQDAQKMGLVDGICSLEDCFHSVYKVASRTANKTKALSELIDIELSLIGV